MSIKFFLTIYICSLIDGACVVPMQEPYVYPKTLDTHAECVKQGLADSFEILYAEKFFTLENIEEYQLYPKYSCDKVNVPGLGI